jgi:hypothetical protein
MRFLNPIRIIAIWIALIIIINIIALPLLFHKSVGGEQRPETFLMVSVKVLAYGILILSIVTIPIYLKWVRKYWYINLIFIIITSIYVLKDASNLEKFRYSVVEKTDSVENSEIRIKLEYYNLDSGLVRSQSFWKNGKKDSIWTIYSKAGTVQSQTRYKNDSLVKIIK